MSSALGLPASVQGWRSRSEPGNVIAFSQGSQLGVQSSAMRGARLFLILLTVAGSLVAPLWLSSPALADHMRANDRIEGSDHDAARAGVNSGRLLPFREVIQRVKARYPGRLLDASLHEIARGEPVYRVLWLLPDGRRITVWVNAKTGQILRVEGAN